MSENFVYTPAMMNGFLVKFYFKDSQFHLIPDGILEKDRDSVREMDRRHAERAIAAGVPERAETGRERKGRKDTGDRIQLTNVRFSYDDSLHLIGCHKHFQAGQLTTGRQREKKSIWVVNLFYSPELSEEPFELEPSILEGIHELQDRAWSLCDVWSNPTLVGTLNFRGLNDNLPEHVITQYSMGAPNPKS